MFGLWQITKKIPLYLTNYAKQKYFYFHGPICRKRAHFEPISVSVLRFRLCQPPLSSYNLHFQTSAYAKTPIVLSSPIKTSCPSAESGRSWQPGRPPCNPLTTSLYPLAGLHFPPICLPAPSRGKRPSSTACRNPKILQRYATISD